MTNDDVRCEVVLLRGRKAGSEVSPWGCGELVGTGNTFHLLEVSTHPPGKNGPGVDGRAGPGKVPQVSCDNRKEQL